MIVLDMMLYCVSCLSLYFNVFESPSLDTINIIIFEMFEQCALFLSYHGIPFITISDVMNDHSISSRPIEG